MPQPPHDGGRALAMATTTHAVRIAAAGPKQLVDRRTQARHRVVIVGGGFAGVYTAKYLTDLLGRRTDVHVELLSEENYFVFQPLLDPPAEEGHAFQQALNMRVVQCPIGGDAKPSGDLGIGLGKFAGQATKGRQFPVVKREKGFAHPTILPDSKVAASVFQEAWQTRV
jgi:hypothetical protein